MEHSLHLQDRPCNCGCQDDGVGTGTSYVHSDCGCQGGLGEADPKSTETAKDLITEAKKYINTEVPNHIKIAAGIGVIALLLVATRGKK